MNIKAHDFPEVYADLGYDLSKLGCIMLEVDSVDIKDKFEKEDLYFAKDPRHFWIDGFLADKPHVTLLYGLLRSGEEMKKHVNKVLGIYSPEGVNPPEYFPESVTVTSLGIFESPYPNEPYDCIVAHLDTSKGLAEANERLKFLPHINTFPEYKAHVTLAYVKKGTGQKYIEELWGLIGKTLTTVRLNYGGDK